jgi:hypothetical protein
MDGWIVRRDINISFFFIELLGFWTFSIVRFSRELKTRRFGNWMCFRPQVKGEKTPTQLGPLERDNLNHCSYLLTLVLRSRIFLPWRWSRYDPPKRRFNRQHLHGATPQKTAFFM